MSEIKAIETRYKGYRFRSRLEARWAVFFDALGIKWEYEPEGFDFDGERYLPDFFLPFPSPVLVGRESVHVSWNGWRQVQAYWLEIKPTEPSQRERFLMLALARETKHHVYCFAGNPWPDDLTIYTATIQGLWINGTESQRRFEEQIQEIRKELGAPGYSLGSLDLVDSALHGFGWNLGFTDSRGALLDAFKAARSARFEHGETPR